jgi:hypothetical protein
VLVHRQQAPEEALGRRRITMLLKEHVKRLPMFVDGTWTASYTRRPGVARLARIAVSIACSIAIGVARIRFGRSPQRPRTLVDRQPPPGGWAGDESVALSREVGGPAVN